MHALERQIFDVIEPSVVALGYELLGVELRQRSRRALLRLYIDASSGIGIEDCERVSQAVSGLLDLEDPLPGEYDLEVSSPGLDRPLFNEAHFRRFIGQKVRVRLSLDLNGRRNFSGRMLGVKQGALEIEDAEGQLHCLRLDEIDTARLIPEWPDR